MHLISPAMGSSRELGAKCRSAAGCLPEGHNFDGGSRHQHVEFVSALRDACRAGRRLAQPFTNLKLCSECLPGRERKEYGETTIGK